MINNKGVFCRLLILTILAGKLTVLQAQVPVHEEPRHRPVFQNKSVRILDVLIPPGDTSQYHIHTTPSLFIWFTATATGSQLKGGKATSGKSVAGDILFENLAPPAIRIHRVWNADRDSFHVMDLELLSKDTGFAQTPLVFPSLKLEIDTGWVRAYRLTLLKGNTFGLRNRSNSFILVSLDPGQIEMEKNGVSENHIIKPGSFFDISLQQSFSLRNISDHAGQFILIELPLQ